MKQAPEPAVCQPTGASSLTDLLPLAACGQRAAPLAAAVESGEPAVGSLRSTAVLLLGYAILITGNGLLATLSGLPAAAAPRRSMLSESL